MPSLSGETHRLTPCPGPVDRESFFAAQNRYRRRTWLISGLCLLAVLVMGLPLSIIIAPLLWTLVALGADVFNLLLPMPDLVTPALRAVQQVLESDEPFPLASLIPLALAALTTGVVTALPLWLRLRSMIRHCGVQAIITTLAAREPRATDLEERQLCNLVEELALAAGLPVPRVLLLDVDTPNAAIFGNHPQEAVLVVSRPLLDDCDRATTQGAIAHLMGSAGTGDLGISLTVVSLLLTLTLVNNLCGMAISPQARRPSLALLLRLLSPGGRGAEDHLMIAQLLHAHELEVGDESQGWTAGIRRVIGLPWLLMGGLFMIAKMIILLFLVGPLMALLGKQRKYLADASAVQLMRDADGLATALDYLASRGAPIAGGHYLSHLFVVDAEAGQERVQRQQQQEMEQIHQEARHGSWSDRLHAVGKASALHRRQAANNQTASPQSAESNLGLAQTLLPPLSERMKRLQRLGARQQSFTNDRPLSVDGERKWSVFTILAMALVGLLLIALLAMVYVVVALSTLLGLGASMAMALLGTALLHPLLRMLAGSG